MRKQGRQSKKDQNQENTMDPVKKARSAMSGMTEEQVLAGLREGSIDTGDALHAAVEDGLLDDTHKRNLGVRVSAEKNQTPIPVEDDLWLGYLFPALADTDPLDQAQYELAVKGTAWFVSGPILARLHDAYVTAALNAAQRYLTEQAAPTGDESDG